MSISMSTADARRRLISWLALAQPSFSDGADGVRELLARLRHIQLDPLDAIGTNADLVALARVDGIARGDVYRHLGPDEGGLSVSFEHFAKVRCILPASFFPWYRDHMPRVPWWKNGREERLGPDVLAAVLAEVAERGPVSSKDLADQGRVRKLDWHGWKSTGRAATMALEVLWTRCEVVVSGKDAAGRRLYDVPSRAFPQVAAEPSTGWGDWALLHRVAAAGLLPLAMGPWWTTLRPERKDGTVQRLVESGALVEVTVQGASRGYLALPELLETSPSAPDDRLRILGPLDPLLWDRKLVAHAFDFEYVWEVYKPASKRRWGWYVCPLLHEGRLVGRIEARAKDDALTVQNLWWEPGGERPLALTRALERHAAACGVARVVRQDTN